MENPGSAPTAPAAYVVPSDVGVVTDPEGLGPVYLGHFPDGPIVVLKDSAAVIFTYATQAPATTWLADLAEDLGLEPDLVAAQGQAFVTELVDSGLLAEQPATSS